MMKKLFLLLLTLLPACNRAPVTVIPPWIPYGESEELAENADHQSPKMRYMLIQSKILDKNAIWEDVAPLSGTLDTPGPMTRTVTDNAILLSAMCGEDSADAATKDNPNSIDYWKELEQFKLEGLRFGVNRNFLEDTLYMLAVEKIVSLGGIAVEFEPEQINLEGFGTLIGVDAPEPRNSGKKLKDYFGSQSSDYLEQLLDGRKVRLEYDVSQYDRFGRTLAYVYLEDGTFINADLVKKGYATVMTMPPNVRYADEFVKLSEKARKQKKGLWKPDPAQNED